MTRPHGITGSLTPTFVPARAVALAVRRPFAFALVVRLPTALRAPSRASVTLSEATAPVKLPASQVRAVVSGRVRSSTKQGWYFTVGSPKAETLGSTPPTYATQVQPTINDRL